MPSSRTDPLSLPRSSAAPLLQPAKKAKHVRIQDSDDDVQVLSDDGDAMAVDDDDEPEDDAANEERIRAEIQSQAKTKELGVRAPSPPRLPPPCCPKRLDG